MLVDGNICWERMVAILVEVYHQSLNDAWNSTMKEFMMLINWRHLDMQGQDTRVSRDDIAGFEEHLANLGVEGFTKKEDTDG